jgi:hypothetical protein
MQSYESSLQDFSLVVRKPAIAVATTNIGTRRIAVRESRFVGWRSGDPVRQAGVINTIAHEMSHLIFAQDGQSFAYADKGHGSQSCPDSDLASYSIGDAAAAVWLDWHPE